MLEELLKNPKSLAEIAILACVYFAVLASIRGTRGAAVLKGAVFLAVVAFIGMMWIANVIGFPHIKLLLQGVLAGSFIALIVVFAPEMRRGLLRLAQAPFVAPFFHAPSLKIVDDLVNACVKLSKNRIGALIAIEREVGLAEYIENGQRLDAQVSSDLLEAIFYPGNPLHDGAMIIQHDRVAAAACLFPLSEDPNLSRTMGTRHRAAIGLSEETDAVVIVVSEETGKISVCTGGKLRGELTRESLDQALRELYSRSGRATLAFRHAAAPGTPPSPSATPSGNGNSAEHAASEPRQEKEGEPGRHTRKRKKS